MVLQTENKLGGQRIPVTKLEDCYKLPGVLIGPDPNACLDRPAANFREDTEKLFQSPLADWMKLDS